MWINRWRVSMCVLTLRSLSPWNITKNQIMSNTLSILGFFRRYPPRGRGSSGMFVCGSTDDRVSMCVLTLRSLSPWNITKKQVMSNTLSNRRCTDLNLVRILGVPVERELWLLVIFLVVGSWSLLNHLHDLWGSYLKVFPVYPAMSLNTWIFLSQSSNRRMFVIITANLFTSHHSTPLMIT